MPVSEHVAGVEIIESGHGYRYKIGSHVSMWHPDRQSAEDASRQVQRLIQIGPESFWAATGEVAEPADVSQVPEDSESAAEALLTGFLNYLFGGANAVPPSTRLAAQDYLRGL